MAEKKSNDIPSAARVTESAVLNFDYESIFAAIRTLQFPFASDVKSVDVGGDISAVGGTRTINYNDGTKQTVQVQEISDLNKSVTYSVVTSEPAYVIFIVFVFYNGIYIHITQNRIVEIHILYY